MNTTLIISSFIAGILTILAPCVLPLLPVIIGSTAGSKNPRKPFVVTASLGASIVLFTLLLKATTLFIDVPQSFWNGLSGGIVFILGLFLLFPDLWSTVSLKLGLDQGSHTWLQKASNNDSLLNSVLIGAALGPVFSSCSPTYFVILATILPANFLAGVMYLVIYALGLMLTLGLVGYFGQRIVMKLKWASNPKGIFKKTMGVLLILVGLSVVTGYNKTVETKIINSGYDGVSLEQKLLGDPQKSEGDPMNSIPLSEKYQDYSPEKVQQAQEEGAHYALFFHAGWCTTCQALEKTILMNINELPEKGIIFKVDYDKANQLKKKFNVLTQSMLVFFDEKGNVIDRNINPRLERIVQSLSGNVKDAMKSYQNPEVEISIQRLKDKKDTFSTSKEYFAFLEKEKSLKQATFAGGCFWCMEGPFEAEKGVIEAMDGYAGGNVGDPSYQEVSTGRTGAREAIDVFYDPRAISYEKLLEIYWRQIDPTDSQGQFADRGFQYTTAILYHDSEQKMAAENSKKELEDSGKFSQIVTQILPCEAFYLAEEYHQDYYKKSADHYHNYKVGSGRDGNIKKNAETFDEILIKIF